jgi:hypothetical protein
MMLLNPKHFFFFRRERPHQIPAAKIRQIMNNQISHSATQGRNSFDGFAAWLTASFLSNGKISTSNFEEKAGQVNGVNPVFWIFRLNLQVGGWRA